MSNMVVRKVPEPRASSVPYLLAVVIMSLVTMVVITVIAVARPDNRENATLYAIIIGFATTTTGVIMTFMKTQETHLSVNSRLSEFIENNSRAERAEGELAGRAAGRDSANTRTDALKVERDTRTDQLTEQKRKPESAPVKAPSTPGSAEPGTAHLEIAATLVGAQGGEAIEIKELAGTISTPKTEETKIR